jgi:hypothetical protein
MPGTKGVASIAATLAALLSLAANPAAAQAARTTAHGAPAAAPAPAAAIPVAGLCQCISNRQTLELMCQPNPQACQSACGTSHYTFVPNAIYSCAPPH